LLRFAIISLFNTYKIKKTLMYSEKPKVYPQIPGTSLLDENAAGKILDVSFGQPQPLIDFDFDSEL
jgi:hypothetical protein